MDACLKLGKSDCPKSNVEEAKMANGKGLIYPTKQSQEAQALPSFPMECILLFTQGLNQLGAWKLISYEREAVAAMFKTHTLITLSS